MGRKNKKEQNAGNNKNEENKKDEGNQDSQEKTGNENQEDTNKAQNPEPIKKEDDHKDEVKSNLDSKFQGVANANSEENQNALAQKHEEKSLSDSKGKESVNQIPEESKAAGDLKSNNNKEEEIDTTLDKKQEENKVPINPKQEDKNASSDQKPEEKNNSNGKIALDHNLDDEKKNIGPPLNDKPEANQQDKNKAPIDQKPEEKKEPQSQVSVDNKSQPNQQDKNKAPIDQKPEEKKEPQSMPSVDDKSQPNQQDKNKAPIDQKPEAKKELQSMPSVDDKPEGKKKEEKNDLQPDESKKQEEENNNVITSKQFIDGKKEELFKLIDFSAEKQETDKFKVNLQKFFAKENISELLKQSSLDDGVEINSQDKIKDMLSKFSKSKKLLLDNNKTLESYLKGFATALNQLLKKHNYTEDDNETFEKLDYFPPSAFNEDLIKKFKSQEKEICLDSFDYKNDYEKYKGEKIIVEIENKKYKKRHGFGYYNNRRINSSFYGTFDNDEYKEGFLIASKHSIFNGEFASEKDTFNGLYVSHDEEAKLSCLMLGETNHKEKTFNGMFIKLQEKSLSLYLGTLKDQIKNSKNSILIDFVIEDSKLDENDLNFKLLYGDFDNDQPVYKNNDFYIYEKNSLLRLTEDKIFSVFSYDETDKLISQGEIVKEFLTGKAVLFDSQNNIYYSGDVENAVYKGKGSLITFDFEDNPSKIIFIRGEIDQDEIKNAKVYFFTKKNAAEKFLAVKNARLSKQFELKFGKINFEDNEYYEGEFKDFQKHGKGKYVYVDESTYEGEWKNDKKDGEGVYFDKDKREFRGTWVDDQIKK